MNEKIVGSIAVIVVIAGGWYLLSKAPASTPQTTMTAATTTNTTAPTGVIVAYTDQGFSPASVTVPLGTSVTFVNQGAGGMWVASAVHPTHTAYSGTSLSQHCPDTTNSTFDACAAVASGGSFSFVFDKEGSWKYHNHADASQTGIVIVTALTTAPI